MAGYHYTCPICGTPFVRECRATVTKPTCSHKCKSDLLHPKPAPIIGSDHAKIPLSQELWMTIDLADLAFASARKIHAVRKSGVPYAYDSISGKPFHRLLLGDPAGMQVDHINHDTLDNRRSNLRVCTQHQNLLNKQHRPHTSIYKGVSLKRPGQWRATIVMHGKQRCVACRSEEEAARAYDAMARDLFGEFAYLNLPA